MKNIEYQEVLNNISNNNLNYYNFYNLDIPTTCHYISNYYNNFKDDNIDKSPQDLNKLYIDIEAFTNFEGISDEGFSQGIYPIYLISIIDHKTREINVFLLLNETNFEKFGIFKSENFDYEGFIKDKENEYINRLKKEKYLGSKYIQDDFKLKLHIFLKEEELHLKCWECIHEIDPDILTGWNTDLFDFPFMYYRLCNLFGKENTNNIMSKFGIVDVRNTISIFEFNNADLLHFYKPRDEGGLNYGEKNFSYTLDNIAEKELELNKVVYNDDDDNLDSLYLNNPDKSTYYNIVDSLLTYGLGNKLGHLDLHNLLRRNMLTPFHSSMIGNSSLFEHFTYNELTYKKNQKIRYSIQNENSRTLTDSALSKFIPPKNKKNIPLKPNKITNKDYNKIINKFPGAYVRQPIGIIINDNTAIIDADAKSLYPSMIIQSNISFDSYIGRIISPSCHQFINFLTEHIGKKSIPNAMYSSLNSMSWDYVDKEDFTSKEKNAINVYYICCYLIDELVKYNVKIERLFNPKTSLDSVYLKTVLIPLLDIINNIHPTSQKYNMFAYDYLLMNDEQLNNKYDHIYILFNPGDSNSYIQKHNCTTGKKIIEKYIISLAGTLFYKHSEKIGLFTEILENNDKLRTKYKDKLNIYKENSYEYNYNNSCQKTVKTLMNTIYGLYGLSSFRYSDHWLARSITNNGMFTIKMAQFTTNEYLNYLYGNKS